MTLTHQTLSPRQAAHDLAEQRLGRALTDGERRIDLHAAVQALERGKADLHDAIQAEKRRAITAHLRTGRKPRMTITPAIDQVLEALYQKGREQALAEIKAAGLEPIRELAVPEPVRRAQAKLKPLLVGITSRIVRETEQGTVSGTFDGMARAAVIRAVDRRVPGALDAASRVVSTAMNGGRGDIYSLNGPLFPDGFVWSALLDGATCEVCDAGDGTEYATWAEGEADLPGGGPANGCLGEGRCRCCLSPI